MIKRNEALTQAVTWVLSERRWSEKKTVWCFALSETPRISKYIGSGSRLALVGGWGQRGMESDCW